jgi:hypothetical protein
MVRTQLDYYPGGLYHVIAQGNRKNKKLVMPDPISYSRSHLICPSFVKNKNAREKGTLLFSFHWWSEKTEPSPFYS